MCNVSRALRNLFLVSFSILLVLCCAALNSEAQDNRKIPSRIEVGGILSAGTQSDIGNYFRTGGGGRITVNATRYLAGEVEATRQPTSIGDPPELHTVIAAKATYRAEQRRWLRIAGLNFFGVLGPAFVNHTVPIGTPLSGTIGQRQTASMLDWGGGFEVVPARMVAVRFDVTHANFSEQFFYSQTINQRRTYLKLAVMLRVPPRFP